MGNDTRITIRLSERERERWQEVAGLQMPLGRWVRQVVNAEVARREGHVDRRFHDAPRDARSVL